MCKGHVVFFTASGSLIVFCYFRPDAFRLRFSLVNRKFIYNAEKCSAVLSTFLDVPEERSSSDRFGRQNRCWNEARRTYFGSSAVKTRFSSTGSNVPGVRVFLTPGEQREQGTNTKRTKEKKKALHFEKGPKAHLQVFKVMPDETCDDKIHQK